MPQAGFNSGTAQPGLASQVQQHAQSNMHQEAASAAAPSPAVVEPGTEANMAASAQGQRKGLRVDEAALREGIAREAAEKEAADKAAAKKRKAAEVKARRDKREASAKGQAARRMHAAFLAACRGAPQGKGDAALLADANRPDKEGEEPGVSGPISHMPALPVKRAAALRLQPGRFRLSLASAAAMQKSTPMSGTATNSAPGGQLGFRPGTAPQVTAPRPLAAGPPASPSIPAVGANLPKLPTWLQEIRDAPSKASRPPVSRKFSRGPSLPKRPIKAPAQRDNLAMEAGQGSSGQPSAPLPAETYRAGASKEAAEKSVAEPHAAEEQDKAGQDASGVSESFDVVGSMSEGPPKRTRSRHQDSSSSR